MVAPTCTEMQQQHFLILNLKNTNLGCVNKSSFPFLLVFTFAGELVYVFATLCLASDYFFSCVKLVTSNFLTNHALLMKNTNCKICQNCHAKKNWYLFNKRISNNFLTRFLEKSKIVEVCLQCRLTKQNCLQFDDFLLV